MAFAVSPTNPGPYGGVVGHGDLLEAPVVDRAGYTLVLRPKSSAPSSFTVQRSATLAMSTCGWADLGAAL